MPPTILVVEDQTDVRENLAETLELAGYGVVEAADGHEGVRAARERAPDLILCDVMMPRLDGYGVLRLLREDEATRAIPLVFLTAKAEREDLRRGMNLGAADYVTKPFFQDELLRVVELRLRRSKVEPEPSSGGDAPGAAAAARPASGIAPATSAEAALAALAELGRVRAYRERAPISFADDRPHAVYRVERGRVRLYRDTEFAKAITVADLGPGAWFGFDALVAEARNLTTAAAYPEAEVLAVQAADAHAALARSGELARWLAQQLAQELGLRTTQLLEIAYYSVRKRIAEFLLRTGGDDGEGDGEALRGRIIGLRREDIAEAVATTPESVTRTLTEFKREGLVEVDADATVRLGNVRGLREVPA